MTVQPQSRRKPGPPATGKGTPVQVRLQPDALARLDAWREEQPDRPSRPEAIRRVVERCLSMPNDADDDDRTSAIGLFNYARSYFAAATRLATEELIASHPDAPVTSLFYHSIELFLKSFLRAAGASTAEMRRFGHDVKNLLKAAVKAGLQPDDEDREVVALMPKGVIIKARYIRTGSFRRPAIEALERTCRSLDELVEQALRARGLTVRAPGRRRPL